LLPVFTGPGRPVKATLWNALRIALPLTLAGTALYAGLVAAIQPGRLAVWLAAAPVLGATGLNGVFAAFLTARRRYPIAILRVPLAAAIALAFAAGLLPGWRSPTALALAVSFGQLCTLAVLAVRSRKVPAGQGARLEPVRLLASAGAIFAATLVGGQLVIVVERFLASGLRSGAVALLAYARGVALLPVMFAQAIGGGVFPAATERLQSLERSALTRLVVTGLRLSLLAGLASTAFVVICRRELVQVAFERHAFSPRDARDTATLVWILAIALPGACAAAAGAKALFALRRRGLVLAISAVTVGLYVVAAVVLREEYGLDGLATAFTISATLGGLAFLTALAAALHLRRSELLRDWVFFPLLFAGGFAAGALAVWLPLRESATTFATALGTLLAVGAGGLAVLAGAVIPFPGPEYALAANVLARLRLRPVRRPTSLG
jgi:putative peptidoglycan lipid II flippase